MKKEGTIRSGESYWSEGLTDECRTNTKGSDRRSRCGRVPVEKQDCQIADFLWLDRDGGAGTTAAGLRAGRPTVICPYLIDQPYWGERVYNLRVGSKPIPQKKLTADNLAEAIREVMQKPSIRQNAEILGKRIREEDGIANAIAVIEKVLQDG